MRRWKKKHRDIQVCMLNICTFICRCFQLKSFLLGRSLFVMSIPGWGFSSFKPLKQCKHTHEKKKKGVEDDILSKGCTRFLFCFKVVSQLYLHFPSEEKTWKQHTESHVASFWCCFFLLAVKQIIDSTLLSS